MRWFRRNTSEPELDAELRYHLEKLIAENLRAGMPHDEARRLALLEFGAVETTKEACRDFRRFSRIQALRNDLTYALRSYRKAPAFTAAVVLSLALGIGASTALFSLVNASILRLIPVYKPHELMWLAVKDSNGRSRDLNYPFYESLQGDRNFAALLCTFATPVHVTTGSGAAERMDAELVSGTYFPALGVRPHLGRLLSPDDDRVRLGHPVAVVSYSYWQSRLGSDPGAVGRTIHVNGSPYMLIGVSQPGFAGLEQGYPRSLFIPMKMKPQVTPGWDGLDKPHIAWLRIVGRLKPGVDTETFSTELNARLHALQKPYLESDKRLSPAQLVFLRGRQVYLEHLRDAVLDARVQQHLRTLAWVVGSLLLLTCANIAGLLLARGIERRRELATRLALGASRGRVIGQLLMESLVLGLTGGLAGLAIGASAAPLLAAKFPLAGLGSRLYVPFDAMVFTFALAISLAAVLVFGMVPAWQSTRLDLISAIKGATQGAGRQRLRRGLLSGQVAVAVVLLVIAGLFATNLQRLLAFDAGFARERLLVGEIEPILSGYGNEERMSLYARLEKKLEGLAESPGSGISAAVLTNVAPMSRYGWSSLFLVDGREEKGDIIPSAVAVGSGYFGTMRVPLKRGRYLTARDNGESPRVAVISESLARHAFAGTDPIGRQFVHDGRKPQEASFEIVGVVGDTQMQDPRGHGDRMRVYLPYRQAPFPPQAMVIQARLAGDGSAAAAAQSIRRVLGEIDSQLALYDMRTIESAIDLLLVPERLTSMLSVFFSTIAALLVGLGLYAILAREVTTRTREIGIRMALGANARRVLWMILRETLLCVVAGVAGGLLVLLLIRPELETLLTGVRGSDPLALAAALLVLTTFSLIASLLPARRATGVNPSVALRWD